MGAGCASFLKKRIRYFDVSHLEIGEIWTFVPKKQRNGKYTDPRDVGDANCYSALDRTTKLIVAGHLGKRDTPHTARLILKEGRSDLPQEVSDQLERPGGIRIGHRSRAVGPVRPTRREGHESRTGRVRTEKP